MPKHEIHSILPDWNEEEPELNEVFSQTLMNIQNQLIIQDLYHIRNAHDLQNIQDFWNIQDHNHIQNLLNAKNLQNVQDIQNVQDHQNVLVCAGLDLRTFFQRVKTCETPGDPGFRGRGGYDLFKYHHKGFMLDALKLYLSRTKDIMINHHHQIEGNIKRLTVSRSAAGKWFAFFSLEAEDSPSPPWKDCLASGIDVCLADQRKASEMCSRCGMLVEKSLLKMVNNCIQCAQSLDRDLKAAINILGLRINSAGIGSHRSPALQGGE